MPGMNWRGNNPSGNSTKVIVASDTITYHLMNLHGHFVADTSSGSIAATIADPDPAVDGWEMLLSADGANTLVLTCTNNFFGDLDKITIAANDTVKLICTRDSSGTLRWVSPDVSPASA